MRTVPRGYEGSLLALKAAGEREREREREREMQRLEVPETGAARQTKAFYLR
jgi:hypothetical protein